MKTRTTETFTDQVRAIKPGESRIWEMDYQQAVSKRQLVSRLNGMGAKLSTQYYDGLFEVKNNAEKEG